jgi:hypothetical protein
VRDALTVAGFAQYLRAHKAAPKQHREQKTDPALKGLRSDLLKDRSKLSREQAMDLNRLVIQFTTKRTARLALSRATAQHPRSQADQRRFHHARGFIEALNGLFQAATKSARLHPLPNHENSPLPHRRKAELLGNGAPMSCAPKSSP